jgi:hypothetical protein
VDFLRFPDRKYLTSKWAKFFEGKAYSKPYFPARKKSIFLIG